MYVVFVRHFGKLNSLNVKYRFCDEKDFRFIGASYLYYKKKNIVFINTQFSKRCLELSYRDLLQ